MLKSTAKHPTEQLLKQEHKLITYLAGHYSICLLVYVYLSHKYWVIPNSNFLCACPCLNCPGVCVCVWEIYSQKKCVSDMLKTREKRRKKREKLFDLLSFPMIWTPGC